MEKKLVITLVIVVAFIIVAAVFFSLKGPASGAYDDFAVCLTDESAVMYGAYWCPHCQSEKKRLGDSFRLVNYVECTEETEKCIAEEIRGYPTWVFSDGRRFEGEMGLEKLSQVSGCPLP